MNATAPAAILARRCDIETKTLALAAALAIAAAAGLLAAASGGGQDQASYEDMATRLHQKGLRELGAYATLEKLVSVGPRPTGSAQADAAVSLMAGHMKQLGFDNVRTEPTVVGHWVRGPREEGRILSRTAGTIPVKVRAIGNSIATPAGGITAGILEVRSVAELEKIGDKARGRIVFFNGAMDPHCSTRSRRTAAPRSSDRAARWRPHAQEPSPQSCDRSPSRSTTTRTRGR